jgi:hypothetical protein
MYVSGLHAATREFPRGAERWVTQVACLEKQHVIAGVEHDHANHVTLDPP